MLSANFPRQVLDLNAAAANGENKQSVEEGSPRDSPPSTKIPQTIAGRRLKNVLMEIENLYLMLLEVTTLTTMVQDSASSAGTASDSKYVCLSLLFCSDLESDVQFSNNKPFTDRESPFQTQCAAQR